MSQLKRTCWGEFLGCLIAGFLGLGVACITFAITGAIKDVFQFAWVFAFLFAILTILIAPISGAMFNPCVTLAFIAFKGMDKKIFFPVFLAQVLGWGLGVFGACYMFKGYMLDFYQSTGVNPATFFYCATPQAYWWSGFGLEVGITFFLILSIFTLTDDRLPMAPTASGFVGPMCMFIVFIVTLAAGFSGSCMNTARDLGPRIFCWLWAKLNGLPTPMWDGYQWLIYIAGPMLGAIIGGLVYTKIFVTLFPKEIKKAVEAE